MGKYALHRSHSYPTGICVLGGVVYIGCALCVAPGASISSNFVQNKLNDLKAFAKSICGPRGVDLRQFC